MSLKDTCEEDDECIAAVDVQFDACHEKYKSDWNAYMNAGAAKEDELMAVYSMNLYDCIIDEDGDPYFEFDVE